MCPEMCKQQEDDNQDKAPRRERMRVCEVQGAYEVRVRLNNNYGGVLPGAEPGGRLHIELENGTLYVWLGPSPQLLA